MAKVAELPGLSALWGAGPRNPRDLGGGGGRARTGTFYARAGDTEIERFGSYETGFNENENDDNANAWPLPNVLGVVAA